MTYKCIYKTPDNFSDIIMNSDGELLTGLWFEGSKDSSKHITDCLEKDLTIFEETGYWLDVYFGGKEPDFIPKYKVANLTPFRQKVIDVMKSIKFGETLTYNDIAKIIAKENRIKNVSSSCWRGGWMESHLYYYSLS